MERGKKSATSSNGIKRGNFTLIVNPLREINTVKESNTLTRKTILVIPLSRNEKVTIGIEISLVEIERH